jgi:hypothetical protein
VNLGPAFPPDAPPQIPQTAFSAPGLLKAGEADLLIIGIKPREL